MKEGNLMVIFLMVCGPHPHLFRHFYRPHAGAPRPTCIISCCSWHVASRPGLLVRALYIMPRARHVHVFGGGRRGAHARRHRHGHRASVLLRPSHRSGAM